MFKPSKTTPKTTNQMLIAVKSHINRVKILQIILVGAIFTQINDFVFQARSNVQPNE